MFIKLFLIAILSIPAFGFAETSGRLRGFTKIEEPAAAVIYKKASDLVKNSDLFCKTMKRGNISPMEFGNLLYKTLDVYVKEGLGGTKIYILYNRADAYDTSYTLYTSPDLTVVNSVHFAYEVYLGDPAYDPKLIDLGDCE